MVVGQGPVLASRRLDAGGREVQIYQWPGPPDAGRVLLLGGCGVDAVFWRDVGRDLAELNVTALNRPGLGGTPWPQQIPTLAAEVATLAELTDVIGSPVVVVAHSMASFHAEALARQHPDRVAGLVIVDGSAEWLDRRPRPSAPWSARLIHVLIHPRPLHGLASILYRRGASAQSHVPAKILGRERIRLAYDSPDALAMSLGEAIAYRRQAWDLLRVRAAHPMPDRPVIVLSAETTGEPDGLRRQRRLADQLGGRQIVVETSKHLMMIDRPQAIARAVRGCLDAAKR